MKLGLAILSGFNTSGLISLLKRPQVLSTMYNSPATVPSTRSGGVYMLPRMLDCYKIPS